MPIGCNRVRSRILHHFIKGRQDRGRKIRAVRQAEVIIITTEIIGAKLPVGIYYPFVDTRLDFGPTLPPVQQ